jgi:hypothetical protein
MDDDDDTQVYKDHGDALTIAYQSGYYDGKKAAQRPWVGLTRTQIQDVYFAILETHRGGHQMEGQLAFGEALQALIKEKNND